MPKKKHDTPSKRQLMLAVICLVIFGVSVVSSVYYRYKYVSVSSNSHSYALKTYEPGEILVDDRFAFSFNSVRTDTTSIPNFWELAPEQHYVLVNMTFTNRSTETYQLSPIKLMHLVDSSGVIHDVTSAPAIKNSLGGPVAPGRSVRGEVGFMLPTKYTNATFTFDPLLVDAQLIRVRFSL